jgi:hypothetical protein
MENLPYAEQYRMIGLGVLIGAGAILIGYIVKLVVPNKHFPWTAGLLASNVVVALPAYVGVEIAGPLLMGWLFCSMFVATASVIADLNLRDEADNIDKQLLDE